MFIEVVGVAGDVGASVGLGGNLVLASCVGAWCFVRLFLMSLDGGEPTACCHQAYGLRG